MRQLALRLPLLLALPAQVLLEQPEPILLHFCCTAQPVVDVLLGEAAGAEGLLRRGVLRPRRVADAAAAVHALPHLRGRPATALTLLDDVVAADLFAVCGAAWLLVALRGSIRLMVFLMLSTIPVDLQY